MTSMLVMQTGPNFNTGAPIFGGLCFIIFALVMVGLAVFIWGTIFKKAGYSFWFGLLMLVPIGNLIWLLIFAFSKWPIEQELEHYRGQLGGYTGHGFPVTPTNMPPPPR
jgi:hypothetical protein